VIPKIFRALVTAGAAALIASAGAVARAQAPVDPAAPLPAGHPAVGSDAPTNQPEEPSDPSEGDAAEQQAMPPGHPGANGAEAPQDRTSPAPDLRAGTIEVHLNDQADHPIASMPVRLGIQKQDVAEGDSHTERQETTDARGIVVFQGLPTGTAYSFRASATKDAGTFSSEPMRLGEAGGQRVLLHVFPVTRDLRQALVGLRGVLFIQPRDDVFHIEASFQVLNIGMQAWVPEGVHLALPTGAKAFRPGDATSDTRFDRAPSGAVELLGTYGPGQHELGYQYQLDNLHETRRAFRIALPPHVAELRLVAEGARGMVLSAEGFPEPEPMQGQDGSRLLVTGKRLARGDAPLDFIEVTLDNLPVPSNGRWYAVGIAVVLAGLGMASAFGQRGANGAPRRTAAASEVKEAEELVLDELVALEKLRSAERIGPRTYEETRLELLDALARLELSRASA
jgi:hypothetical protein